MANATITNTKATKTKKQAKKAAETKQVTETKKAPKPKMTAEERKELAYQKRRAENAKTVAEFVADNPEWAPHKDALDAIRNLIITEGPNKMLRDLRQIGLMFEGHRTTADDLLTNGKWETGKVTECHEGEIVKATAFGKKLRFLGTNDDIAHFEIVSNGEPHEMAADAIVIRSTRRTQRRNKTA